MESNVVIPWYQSRIIWAQIIAIAFALASALKFDLGEYLGMSQEAFLALVMTIISVATVIIRGTLPAPDVAASKSKADQLTVQRSRSSGVSSPGRPFR